jgi:hypothetical protein
MRWLCTPGESVGGFVNMFARVKMNRRKYPMLTRCGLKLIDTVSRERSELTMSWLTYPMSLQCLLCGMLTMQYG